MFSQIFKTSASVIARPQFLTRVTATTPGLLVEPRVVKVHQLLALGRRNMASSAATTKPVWIVIVPDKAGVLQQRLSVRE